MGEARPTPVDAEAVDVDDLVVDAVRPAVVVGGGPAGRDVAEVVDDQKPPGDTFGYNAVIACQVDSYMSPSSRITAIGRDGRGGQRVLEPAVEKLHLVVEQAVAGEVRLHGIERDGEALGNLGQVVRIGPVFGMDWARKALERVGAPDSRVVSPSASRMARM